MHRAPLAGWPAEAPLVRAVGTVRFARVEPALRAAEIDHVWLSLDAGLSEDIEVAINTFSHRNRDAGFDPRVRVGIFREVWDILPAEGVSPLARFSYEDCESRANIFYEFYERPALELLLLDSAHHSLCAEVIGRPYHRRPFAGIHQIHSRRASCAVPEEMVDLDGSIRFYFPTPRETRRMFFKFCGQP